MRDPDRAVNGPQTQRAMALAQDLARRSPEAFFLVRTVQIHLLAEQRVQHARATVPSADLPRDLRRGVAGPVDAAVDLPDGWAEHAAHLGAAVVEWFRGPVARREVGHCFADG